jgi:hypothetical protein
MSAFDYPMSHTIFETFQFAFKTKCLDGKREVGVRDVLGIHSILNKQMGELMLQFSLHNLKHYTTGIWMG